MAQRNRKKMIFYKKMGGKDKKKTKYKKMIKRLKRTNYYLKKNKK